LFEGSQLEEEEEERGRKRKQARSEQATESTRRMPRRSRPKKDAETGETFRGSCMQAKSPEIPNGATPPE
jgi:hypothetical protein